MPTLENFDARSLALNFEPILRIKQALDQNKNRDFKEKQLALQEEIQRGNLDVAEAELILRQDAGQLAEDKFQAQQTNQGNIQDKLGKLIRRNQEPAAQADPSQDVGGIPAPAIQPSRIPLPQSEAQIRELENGLLELGAIGKDGLAIAKVVGPILKGRDERAKLAFEKFVKEKQRFSLSLRRMKTRDQQDRAIKNEINKQRLSPEGRVDPYLPELLNMNDTDREQGLFLNIAQGDVLQKLAENAIVPPKALDKFEDVVNEKGQVVAQRNVTTGEVKKSPLATGGVAEKATFAKSPGVVVELPDGTFAQSIPVIDTRTGQIVNKLSPLEGQPVSRLGETGEELTARKIREAGGKTGSVARQKRIQIDIDDGISAAKGMAVINRSIKLLEDLKTGGFDAVKLRLKQFLGTETANEAELVANMGKQVLAQLRPIFGSQFTKTEGDNLARIEAGFGKSTAGNIRLLNQLKQLIQRSAKRGIAAAKETDDFRSALDIRELMETTLLDEAPETDEALGLEKSGTEDLSKLSIEELLAR